MKRRPNYKSRKTIINIILITLLIAMTSTGIYIFTKANDNAEAFSKENIEMPENTQIGSNNEETQQNQEQENVQVNINNNQNTQVNNTTNNPTNNKTNTTQIKDQEVIDIVKETVETGTDGKYLSWKQTSNSIEKITTNVESTEVTIELSANVDKVEINGEITYTIKISSNKELKNVPVKDLIPEMTTFKAVENNGKEILDENGKVVALRWEVDLKEENNYIAEIKFTVTVNEDATGKILNSEAIANGKKIENPVEVSVLSHILFVENGGTEVEDIINKDSKTAIENKEMPTTSKIGYVFEGWYDNENFEGNKVTTLPEEYVAGTTTYYAKWIPATDTKYIVQHHQQNIENDEYTLVDTENLTGTTDEQTSAVAKNYEGFTVKEFAQVAISPDGSTVVDIYYDRNIYTITYKITGNIDATEDFAHSDLKYGQDVTPVEKPSKTGYTFVGWDNEPTTMPNNNVTVEGKYEANTDTAYKVQHHQQNANDDGYTLVDTENLTGTTDEQTNAVAKNYEGFTVKDFAQIKILPDGSSVVDIYYDRNVYTITYKITGNIDATEDFAHSDLKYGQDVTPVEKPTKTGYTFIGWDNEPTTMPNSNVTVEGKYEPNTDTAYTVKHHQQNANDNEYTLADTENLTGTTDELTSAVAKNYEGFTVKTFEQKTIAPDGSTVVDIYYDRNVYTITYNIIGTKFAQDNYAQQEYKYEANVETASEPQVKEGYTFSGWSTIPTTMPNNDVTVEGKYEPNTDTAYTVKHYQQNANDDGYTLVDTENLTGTTDELTNAVAKEYTGFTVKTFEQKTIAPDGSTVVDIYYDRNVYTVNFNANDSEATGETPSQVVKFGEEITLNENRFEKYNYEFRDWNTATDGTGSSYKDKANFQVTQNNIAIVNNNNIELYAQWTLLDAKFDIGSNVNKTIKELVNPQSIEKSNIAPTDLSVCKNVSITSTPIYIWLDEEDTSKVLWYTKDPTPELNENCSNMFRELNIAYEDITKICGTKNVTNMSGMFKRCYKLTTVDVSNFDTSNVTNMSAMFEGCRILPTLDVSNFDTSKVTNMLGMFEECSRLTTLDVSKFDTSNVTNMSNMFKSCSSLTTLNISNFDTSNVKNMNSMFCNCSNLKTLDVSNWNTSKVTNMGEMFAFCSEKLTELDLSNFDTSNVTNMSGMFTCCRILTTIYSSDNFVTEQVKNSTRMFDGCSKLQGGNGTRYSSSKVDKEYARIDKEETPGYFTSKESLETVSQQNEDSTLSSNKQEEMSSFRMVKGNVPTTTITKTETPVTLETVTKVETPVAPMDEEKIKQEEQEEVKQKETTQGNSNNKDDAKTKNVDKTDEIKTTISTETKNSTVTEKETIKE